MGRKSRALRPTKSLNTPSILHNQKNRKVKKKKRSKTKKNIKKLFERLRNVSGPSTYFDCKDSTVIEVDSIEDNDALRQTRNCSSNFVVIGDDEDLLKNKEPCPIQCSTPLSTSKHILQTSNSPSRINNNSNSTQDFQKEVENLTKEINRDSYLTIDLTTESNPNATGPLQMSNSVIDLVNTPDKQGDCTLSNDNLSMSGDSDVTVINTKTHRRKLNSVQMKNFVNGIAKLDSSERGKLLEVIAQTIFHGCSGSISRNVNLHNLKNRASSVAETVEVSLFNRATETIEDTYIKEVILGQASSRNSIGSNIYNPERDIRNKTGLRMIIIDGSNVAMQHSKGRVFSVKGLKICIDYFVQRGHVVKAFVPHFRCKMGKSTNGKLLDVLERQGLVVYTPSREIQGRMINSYDDRYIVQCAAEFDAVIVSGDNYRDLLRENPRWRSVIENRLLQFTWVGDMIMFPRDPLGRCGPTLQQFLKHPS